MPQAIPRKSSLGRVKPKSSSLYKNESWDVVDAYEAAPEAIISMDDAELPDVMKGMDAEARRKFVEGKTAERAAIQAQIKTLEGKRTMYVADTRKSMDAAQTLDNVMVSAIKRQASEKGYVFEKTQ